MDKKAKPRLTKKQRLVQAVVLTAAAVAAATVCVWRWRKDGVSGLWDFTSYLMVFIPFFLNPVSGIHNEKFKQVIAHMTELERQQAKVVWWLKVLFVIAAIVGRTMSVAEQLPVRVAGVALTAANVAFYIVAAIKFSPIIKRAEASIAADL